MFDVLAAAARKKLIQAYSQSDSSAALTPGISASRSQAYPIELLPIIVEYQCDDRHPRNVRSVRRPGLDVPDRDWPAASHFLDSQENALVEHRCNEHHAGLEGQCGAFSQQKLAN